MVQPVAFANKKYVGGWKEIELMMTPKFCIRNYMKRVALAEEENLQQELM